MKQKKVRFLVGSLLIVGAIGYLITMGISNTSQYFFTVDELLSQKISYAGAGLKVKGNVVNGSIQRDPNDYLDVKFLIEEKESSLKVTYQGVTPDMFCRRPGSRCGRDIGKRWCLSCKYFVDQLPFKI